VSLKKLGRYDLVRVLGKGAMGIVYEGRDPNLDRRVAIKTVKVENLSEEAAAEYEHRFRTEARSAARLQHPNIVSVYDSDRDGDVAFLVMEYIQGDDLKHHLDKGIRYSLEQSLKMIRDLLSALDYAHKQGIVHRDVKPANLLIEPGGRVKLTDFGVARIQDSGEATRTQGSMVGTLKYMSPEQVQGQKIDSRADLFSVGVVLYQLLTDKRPFDGDNDFSIIHQIIGHTPAPPSSFNARLPSAIDAVVARALAKDRDQRFATARDFATALQSAIRRAEDATVVPPADPFKKKDTSGTGSKGALSAPGGASGTSGSAVTQELELLYWKDVRDSTEPEELEGFLAKFPAGIYADLARRRLRKLTTDSSPDQTILSGATVPPADQDLEATRMRSGTTPSTIPVSAPQSVAVVAKVAAAVAAAAAPHPAVAAQPAVPPPPSSKDDYTRTIIEPRVPEEPVEHAAIPAKESPAQEAAAAPAARAPGATAAPPVRDAAKPAAKKPMLGIAVAAGVAAIALIAGGVMLSGKGPGSGAAGPAAAASARAQDASGAVPAASLAAGKAATDVPASAAAPAVAAVSAAPLVAASKASVPKRPASALKSKAKPASAPASELARPAAAMAPARREEAKPASTPAPATASVEVCRDKMFLAKEFCLVEECAKPGSRNHPLCVKHREEVRLREESKIRN
jgi:eukaryotic-like serine/threonine-protein kinase